MQHLRATLIQTELHWQAPEANRAMLDDQLAGLASTTDLIVLPEMFSTGFSMAPEQGAEVAGGETVQWLQARARELGAAITGSLAIKTEEGFVNRLFFATPEGALFHYDKRHLFRMGGEHEHYQSGCQRQVFHWRGWRILPLICYDLRFPVFSRNRDDYDLMVCVANWPAPRRHPWRTLLQARAIENLCYVAGVNRVGTDGNGLEYSGDSMLVDFKGEALMDQPASQPFIRTECLDLSALQSFRTAFPAHLDADGFRLDTLED